MTSAVWSRSLQRGVHLLLAFAPGAFVYSPLRTVEEAVLVVQGLVVPLLTLSGLLLWQGPRLKGVMS